MSYNIENLLKSSNQNFLTYPNNPFKVEANKLPGNRTMFASKNEYLKQNFAYPTMKVFDYQNTTFNKDKVHQTQETLEFKLDIESNNIVTMLFVFLKYRNKNTNSNKCLKHYSPINSIESVTLHINQAVYSVKPEEIHVFNCVRLSHGDKVFPNLIDNIGITSSYDIDKSTNVINPASNSPWYFFGIPLFAHCNIPWNVLTSNSNDPVLVKVSLEKDRFIMPSSPTTNYNDLALYDCKLIASMITLAPLHYQEAIASEIIDYRFNDTTKSTIIALNTTNLISDSKQQIKYQNKQGGYSLLLMGLRERNNPAKFASYIPLDNVGIKRKNNFYMKSQSFDSDILRNLNTYELSTGDFFLVKNLVAFSFDAMIDQIITMNYHGAVEIFDDEFTIEFDIVDKGTNINSNKSYELVLILYEPKVLRLNTKAKKLSIIS